MKHFTCIIYIITKNIKKIIIPSSLVIVIVIIIILLYTSHKDEPITGKKETNNAVYTTITPTPTETPQPTEAPTPTIIPTPSPSVTGYKDGNYIGNNTPNSYGNVQVEVSISEEKITDIQFLQLPNNLPHSRMISSEISPILKQEAISAQNANIDVVSGATQTS